MDITAVNRIPSVQTPSAPIDQAAGKRQMIKAVSALNSSQVSGPDNELRFTKDPHTRKMVLQVVNRQTNEVISQLPPEYVIRLAEDLKQNP